MLLLDLYFQPRGSLTKVDEASGAKDLCRSSTIARANCRFDRTPVLGPSCPYCSTRALLVRNSGPFAATPLSDACFFRYWKMLGSPAKYHSAPTGFLRSGSFCGQCLETPPTFVRVRLRLASLAQGLEARQAIGRGPVPRDGEGTVSRVRARAPQPSPSAAILYIRWDQISDRQDAARRDKADARRDHVLDRCDMRAVRSRCRESSRVLPLLLHQPERLSKEDLCRTDTSSSTDTRPWLLRLLVQRSRWTSAALGLLLLL